MKVIEYSFFLVQLSTIIVFASINPVSAQMRGSRGAGEAEETKGVGASGRSLLQIGKAEDLMAQGITRVTGVELNQTDSGLEVIPIIKSS